MKLTKIDWMSQRVIGDNGEAIGLALLLANNRWGAFSIKEERLTKTDVSFAKPGDVLEFFKLAAKEIEKTGGKWGNYQIAGETTDGVKILSPKTRSNSFTGAQACKAAKMALGKPAHDPSVCEACDGTGVDLYDGVSSRDCQVCSGRGEK